MNNDPYPIGGGPLWLVVLRSGTGMILLLSLWSIWPDYALLYGAPWWRTDSSILFQGAPLLVVYSLLCLLLTAQILPRIAAVGLLWLHHSLFIQPTLLAYGFDYLCATALFFCAVIPRRITRLPLRTIQVSLCIIYFSAGLAKALGPTWWTGEALWKASTLPGFEGPLSPVVHLLSGFTGLWIIAGWLVILIEVCYPIFVWLRPTRMLWIWLTVGLHIAIALIMALYGFSAFMILLNLIAFYLPHLRATQRFQLAPINYHLYLIRLFRWRAKPSRH